MASTQDIMCLSNVHTYPNEKKVIYTLLSLIPLKSSSYPFQSIVCVHVSDVYWILKKKLMNRLESVFALLNIHYYLLRQLIVPIHTLSFLHWKVFRLTGIAKMKHDFKKESERYIMNWPLHGMRDFQLCNRSNLGVFMYIICLMKSILIQNVYYLNELSTSDCM